ncbi:peptidoglycan-binding protein [Xanthomonas translucens]|uniref:peptidoglycan-binding domain-containing protein n=1 Tax=Xanthomonas campestris pv. translucens TaxID=343 RepID=UPI001F374F9B|nr:peptidoglycan-binding protein [Xanthomonas translucens]UKE51477.1 peptidoglycan-binding protein [Xanthomonas translucens]
MLISKKDIPPSLFPNAGLDIDQTFKKNLNHYLATDSGKSFVHERDVAQLDKLMDSVVPTLKKAEFYKNSNPEDQAKIFAATAKAYNQGDAYGRKILDGIREHEINSIDDINKKINTFPSYMHTGRDDALRGAETFNALRNASQTNPLHAPWQAVVANPLVNPTQLHADPKHAHLAEQYATVKGIFVDPVQGRAFVQSLEHGGSHNYGDPAKSNSRGFYAEGKDFVQWDRDGHGRAFVAGQWSEFSRNELALAHHRDGTLDVNISRNGQTHSLLHLTHPSSHHQSQPSAHHAHETSTLRQGMQSEQVKTLQTQLGELGYLDNTVPPHGKYGSTTAKAVQSFQHDHHLPEVGRVGPATEKAIQADLQPLTKHTQLTSSTHTTLGQYDPRNPENSNHALYSELHRRIPDASENRLLQFTAACHSNKITADNLSTVYLDEANMKIGFAGSSLLSTPTLVDLNARPPQPEQSIQQIQQHDQQQAQMIAQTQMQMQMQMQNSQINTQR